MSKFCHKQHIFFDLDHTLWDFDKNSELAFSKIFHNRSLAIDIIAFIEAYVPINQAVWKLYQKDIITSDELRFMRLQQSFQAINFNITNDDMDQIAADYINFLPENNILFDGAHQVLAYLKKNYVLHIITNGFADVQNKKLLNSNISQYFSTITNSETANAKKPSAVIYNHALSVANAHKQESIMIGDCLDADVNGAINFGIDAIFVNHNKITVDNNLYQVQHLLQLQDYF